jgi:hypothetical protein
MEPGDIVGVHAGVLRRATAGADHVLVISTAPAVIANGPARADRERFEKVAMLGQCPVKVRGPVAPGNVIVPSGKDDGTGVAISATSATLEEHATSVGIAWEASRLAGLARVRCAIGLTPTHVWRSVAEAINPTDASSAGEESAPRRGKGKAARA